LNPLGLLLTSRDDVNCGRYLPALLAAAGEVLLLFVLLLFVLLLFVLLPELSPALPFEVLAPLPEPLPELAEADSPELPFPLPLSLLAEVVSELPSDFADPLEAGVVFLRA
jgi:hypothetical protein